MTLCLARHNSDASAADRTFHRARAVGGGVRAAANAYAHAILAPKKGPPARQPRDVADRAGAACDRPPRPSLSRDAAVLTRTRQAAPGAARAGSTLFPWSLSSLPSVTRISSTS